MSQFVDDFGEIEHLELNTMANNFSTFKIYSLAIVR